MAVYTVHAPPLKPHTSNPDPERFAFVRDGFWLSAFLFGPLWMLRHRMWLVLLGYIVVTVALEAALRGLEAPTGARIMVGILLAWLIGFEAPTLRRFNLARRKWTNVGVIVGDDRENAERRFFDAWAKAERGEPPTVGVASAAVRPRQAQLGAEPDVIGLFPKPGAPR